MNKKFLSAITALALFGCDNNGKPSNTLPQSKPITTTPPAAENDIAAWNAVHARLDDSYPDLDSTMSAPGLKQYISDLFRDDSYLKNLLNYKNDYGNLLTVQGDGLDGWNKNFLQSLCEHGADIVLVPSSDGNIGITTLNKSGSGNVVRQIYYVYKKDGAWKHKISNPFTENIFNALQDLVTKLQISGSDTIAQKYILEYIDEFEGKLNTGTANPTTGFAISSDGATIVNSADKTLKVNTAGDNVEFA